jgi:hypothetical protein
VVENKWCRNLIINFPKPFCYPNTQFGEISGLELINGQRSFPVATQLAGCISINLRNAIDLSSQCWPGTGDVWV